jgi:hypothetical protein
MDNQTEQNFLRLVTAEVTRAIAQALETLIHKKGFEVPIYMAAIGSNGYVCSKVPAGNGRNDP